MPFQRMQRFGHPGKYFLPHLHHSFHFILSFIPFVPLFPLLSAPYSLLNLLCVRPIINPLLPSSLWSQNSSGKIYSKTFMITEQVKVYTCVIEWRVVAVWRLVPPVRYRQELCIQQLRYIRPQCFPRCAHLSSAQPHNMQTTIYIQDVRMEGIQNSKCVTHVSGLCHRKGKLWKFFFRARLTHMLPPVTIDELSNDLDTTGTSSMRVVPSGVAISYGGPASY
jgi:hypothetical protein